MSADSIHSSGDSASSLNLPPTVTRNGRTYLREVPYPLPCDLQEWQRQDLSTYLRVEGPGMPLRCPWLKERPPTNILDVGCGTGYWSALIYDYLTTLDETENLKLTGVDVADICPDFKTQGMDWHFVQHDLRKTPLPFDDGEFDLILVKDICVALPQPLFLALFEDLLRLLRKGGTIEIWEFDYGPMRALAAPGLIHPDNSMSEQNKRVVTMGAFLIQPGTPFANPQNTFLQDYSKWIKEALEERSFTISPCSLLTTLLFETEGLKDVGLRRVAVPLGESKGERDAARTRGIPTTLTPQQQAARELALSVVIQTIESLEPLLKEASGKTEDEWQRWWTAGMDSILRRHELTAGECFEVGYWWARKT